MTKQIPVSELKFGMYVAELDRPWTDTPFVFQGFVLSTQQQLDTLRKYCKTVFIDVERSRSAAPPPARRLYPERASVEQEFRPAQSAYQAGRGLLHDVLGAVRVGRTLDVARVAVAVRTMTESVLRNPDALLLFGQLRSKGDYTESHAIDVSIYMITLGRFLQLAQPQIEFLGYLGLLQDVGKVRLATELLDKRGRLSLEEFERAKLHVRYSEEILRATPGLPADLARMAGLHHERVDGSGYPKGLRGPEIGMFGLIAGIVDTFDALTVKRPYADPVSPSAAISMLYKRRGIYFDANLVEQFIRCIGIFPVGSLVELNTGEVGVVIAQNPAKRLLPRVMVIRDAKRNPMLPQKLLDLARAPMASKEEPYRIRGTLERGAVPVEPGELFLSPA
ncbi:MAG TPA: HD-GYP domain-containing protein [Burkholderiales bacterium]|nr:HD-GYP domain-containing protein [Burkholderiales bacterium]